MSAAPIIIIDGHTLNDTFRISDITRSLPERRVTRETIPGRHGDVVTDRSLGVRTVSFRLWAKSGAADHESLVATMADLVTWLLAPDSLTLTLSDEGGRAREVVVDGELNFEEYEEGGSLFVTLTQLDPFCAIGAPKTLSVPSGGSASMAVAYDLPHIAIVATSAKRANSSLVWGLRFDDSTVLHVRLPDASTHRVEIDCEHRTAKVDGSTSMVTLDSDWPSLRAGTHSVRMDEGTGAATLTWQERCL